MWKRGNCVIVTRSIRNKPWRRSRPRRLQVDTAGLVVPCPLNTYNNETDQTFATACALCPLNSLTANESSTSIDDCVCAKDFYDTIMGPGVDCAMCPVGTACIGGATIDRLPILPGYFRLDDSSIDLRKCPDASSNCDDAPVCANTTSGCRGGTDMAKMIQQ